MADGKSDDSKPKTVMPSIPVVTEHEREMANHATEEFEKRNYDGCTKILTKLSETRGPDPRVAMNVAVIDFYKSNFTQTDEFKKALFDAARKARVNVDKVTGLDDVDQCVFYYNYAVLLYHLRQYKTSLAILVRLFQFTEPMEESLAQKVSQLLVEVYLATSQPEKAIGVLGFLEKSVFGNGKSQQQASGDKEKEKDEKSQRDKDSPTEGKNSEHMRAKLSFFKARCYMQLRSMKSYKREIKSLVGSMGSTAAVMNLKANFEHLRGNHRKALKLLNSSPATVAPTSATGESRATMYYNNMGVLHFHLRKHNLAAFYFRKALQENEHACSEFNKIPPKKSLSGRPIQTLGISRHMEILYSTGIQLLHCGKPEAAFDCLKETVAMFRINPRLWLRLAECCIMHHKANNDDDRDLDRRMQVVKGSVGTGVHRKLIFGSGITIDNLGLKAGTGEPALTLEFAALCLRNALTLLPEDPLDAAPPNPDSSEPRPNPESVLVLAPPGSPMRASEVANLRCAVLAASAYTALTLSDYTVAKQHAHKLLLQPHLSGAYRYLGHMYVAEAQVALDHIADAVQHLNPEAITDVSVVPPETKHEPGEKNGDKEVGEQTEAKAVSLWEPRDVGRARAIMQYNLATAHAIRGEYEKALNHLAKSTGSIGVPLPAQMYFLKIYLELMEGRRKVAQGVIKEHFGHLTPNRV